MRSIKFSERLRIVTVRRINTKILNFVSHVVEGSSVPVGEANDMLR